MPSQEHSHDRALIASYVPVIHAGYMNLLSRHLAADVGVLGTDIIEQFPYLRKEIRALTPEQAVRLIAGLGRTAFTLSEAELQQAHEARSRLIMPYDDVSRSLTQKHQLHPEFEPVFLRWHRENRDVNVEVRPDRVVTPEEAGEEIVGKAWQEAGKSSNWWRQLGAIAVAADGTILLATHNSSMPTEYASTIDSDPRILSKRGEKIELTLDLHAEAALVANAARQGISLEDARLYVTTFPCPNCAKLIGQSGIHSCYFIEGYAMLDGLSALKNAGVVVVKIVGVERPMRDERAFKPYPES